MRWGTNKVAGTGEHPDTLTFATNFTKIVGAGSTANEAQGADGDSGGAVFIKNGTTWELAGVMIAIATFEGQPAGYAASMATSPRPPISRSTAPS